MTEGDPWRGVMGRVGGKVQFREVVLSKEKCFKKFEDVDGYSY